MCVLTPSACLTTVALVPKAVGQRPYVGQTMIRSLKHRLALTRMLLFYFFRLVCQQILKENNKLFRKYLEALRARLSPSPSKRRTITTLKSGTSQRRHSGASERVNR